MSWKDCMYCLVIALIEQVKNMKYIKLYRGKISTLFKCIIFSNDVYEGFKVISKI